jgi:hypothetical protein
MIRPVAVVSGLVLLGLFAAVAAPPLSAFPLTTCTLTVISRDAGGTEIGTAVGAGAGATRDNPLLIDPKGSVEWTGTTGGSPLTRPSYHVEIFGVPTPLGGGAMDDGPRSGASGDIAVGDVLPFAIVGTVYVSGAVDVGGSPVCEGSGWIKLTGEPLSSPVGLAGAGLALIGIASVLASVSRRHPFRGLIGGAIGGAGLALLSGVTGILPFDEKTPVATMVVSVIFGLLIGAISFGDIFRRGAGTRPTGTGSTGAATAPVEPAGQPDAGAGATSPAAATAPVVQPTTTPSATGTSTPSAPSVRPPSPAFVEVRTAIDGLAPEVKPHVQPLLQQAQAILTSGPGSLTIGSDVIGRIAAQAGPAFKGVTLGNGAIDVSVEVKIDPAEMLGVSGLIDIPTVTETVSVTATPTVEGGRLALDLGNIDRAAKATGMLDGLVRFLDLLNKAVAEAGQRIAAVSVTPEGIVVTTATAG